MGSWFSVNLRGKPSSSASFQVMALHFTALHNFTFSLLHYPFSPLHVSAILRRAFSRRPAPHPAGIFWGAQTETWTFFPHFNRLLKQHRTQNRICQRKHHIRFGGLLLQASVSRFTVSQLPLHHRKDVFNLCPDRRFLMIPALKLCL